jgi:ketosteroid isomerase-like protein
MSVRTICVLLGAVACAFLAPTAHAADSAELATFKAAIRAKYDLKERAFASHDAATIVEKFYAPDVISTDEQGKTHVGTAGIRPLYEEVVKGSKVRVESVYPHVNGDAGWDWANFYVAPDDPNEKPFSFKILFLWEKVNGEWWCKGDFYTLGRFGDEAATH